MPVMTSAARTAAALSSTSSSFNSFSIFSSTVLDAAVVDFFTTTFPVAFLAALVDAAAGFLMTFNLISMFLNINFFFKLKNKKKIKKN